MSNVPRTFRDPLAEPPKPPPPPTLDEMHTEMTCILLWLQGFSAAINHQALSKKVDQATHLMTQFVKGQKEKQP